MELPEILEVLKILKVKQEIVVNPHLFKLSQIFEDFFLITSYWSNLFIKPYK